MRSLSILLITMLFCSFSIFAQNALNFDGSNDLVQTNYSGVTGSADRTFEAWIYVPSSAPASNLCILDYGTNAAGDRNTFAVSGTRKLTFTSGGTNANIGSTLTDVVPEDQWVHVAFVLSSGTGYVYVNGVEEGSGSLTSVSTPTGVTNVRIGQRVTGGSIPFNGVIDEVRVWSVARTLAEIQADMNDELCGVQPNLELYLKFNEGMAGGTNTGITSAVDNSGNANTGTLTNFALTGPTSNWVNGSGITSLSTTGSDAVTSCGTYIYPPTSTVYTSSGIYTETLLGANSVGCDSIVTLDVTINNSTFGSDVQSVCDSFTWINGVTYTSSATATYILTNSVGCDSIVALDLTINNNSSTDVQSACDSYTWIDGNTYTSSNNTATFTLTNSAGCDSIVTLDLTIGTSNSSTDLHTVCDDSFTWIDGNTYTTSNNSATFTLTNSTGCDSIVTLDLTLDGVSTAVTQSATGEELTADQTGATYQWVECPGFTPISGATNQTYTATTNGDYAVIVSSAQCADTSACFSVTTVGIDENDFGQHLALYPNPTNGNFTIDLGEVYDEVKVEVTNVLGKQVLAKRTENTQEINVELIDAPGVYLVSIKSQDKQTVIRIVKE